MHGSVRLSLSTKIFLGFMVLLGTSALLAFLSVREIRAVAQELRAIKDGHLALARLAAQVETHQQNRLRDLKRGLSETDPRNQEVILRIAVAYFPEVIRSTLDEALAVADAQARLAEKDASRHGVLRAGFYRGIKARVGRIAELHEKMDDYSRALVQRTKLEAPTEELQAGIEALEDSLRSETYQLNKFINDETDAAVRRAEQEERNALWRVILVTVFALLVGLLLTFLSARALAPIGRLVRFARAISRGDYEQGYEAHGDDQLSSLADELKLMARSRKEREEALDRQAQELERAYRRVAELKGYHESVVRSLRTAVVVVDRGLNVTSTNRAAETHWDLRPGLRGQAVDSLPVGKAIVERTGPLQSLLDKRESVHLDAVSLGELLADVTIAPLENEAGDVLGLVLALEDVTEAIRTKEALIRSERLAAIGRMSAHVTHEIRNPLSSIGLNAELLAELIARIGPGASEGAEATALCQAIVREVDRLTAITEEYLRFARLPRPELRDEDVTELVRTIGAFVRRDCESANVQLSIEVPPALPRVPMDADQMRQAILNLVRNAKESMPQGGELWLGATADQDSLAFIVRDTGIGIPPDDVGRIFDPFFSTKLTGTGLGLALSQQIVSEHGGEIRVSSAPGQGSEFRIVMPIHQGLGTQRLSGGSAPIFDPEA